MTAERDFPLEKKPYMIIEEHLMNRRESGLKKLIQESLHIFTWYSIRGYCFSATWS